MKIRLLCIVLFLFQTVHAQQITLIKTNDFQIESIRGKEVVLGFTSTVENFSNKKFKVKIKRGKLYKDGEYYGEIHLVEKVTINRNSKEEIPVRLKVLLVKELNLMEIGIKAFSGQKTEVRATGFFKAGWLIFWKKFPFDYSEHLSL